MGENTRERETRAAEELRRAIRRKARLAPLWSQACVRCRKAEQEFIAASDARRRRATSRRPR